jgi:hypothetical protein
MSFRQLQNLDSSLTEVSLPQMNHRVELTENAKIVTSPWYDCALYGVRNYVFYRPVDCSYRHPLLKYDDFFPSSRSACNSANEVG